MTSFEVGNCITNSNGALPLSQDPLWNVFLHISLMPLGIMTLSGLFGYFVLDIPIRRKLKMVMPIAEEGIPFISYAARLHNYVSGVVLERYRQSPPKSKRFNPLRRLHYNDSIYGREVNMRALMNRFQIGYCWLFAISLNLAIVMLIPLCIHDFILYPEYGEFREYANDKLSYWRKNPETPFPEFVSLPKECR